MGKELKVRWLAWGALAAVVAIFATLAQGESRSVSIASLIASEESAEPIIDAVTVGLLAAVSSENNVNHITQNTVISSSSVNHITQNAVISSSSVNHITQNAVISSSSVNHITQNTVISSSSVQHITQNTIITSPLQRVGFSLVPRSAELPVPQIRAGLASRERI